MPHRFEASKQIPMVVVDAESLDRILQVIVDRKVLTEEDETLLIDFDIIGNQLHAARNPPVKMDDFPAIMMEEQA